MLRASRISFVVSLYLVKALRRELHGTFSPQIRVQSASNPRPIRVQSASNPTPDADCTRIVPGLDADCTRIVPGILKNLAKYTQISYLGKTTLSSPNRSRTEISLRKLYRIDRNHVARLVHSPKIRKSDNLNVFHKYDVVFDNTRFQKIVPNHFDQTTLICIVWWYQMWYMW